MALVQRRSKLNGCLSICANLGAHLVEVTADGFRFCVLRDGVGAMAGQIGDLAQRHARPASTHACGLDDNAARRSTVASGGWF